MEVFCIVGPTGSGKSYIAHSVARKLKSFGVDVEIISCDSVQVYKYFDIGTDKVSKEYREEVKYHLIDILEPNEGRFSAGEFRKRFDDIVKNLVSDGKFAILVGGTGLYYKAVRIGIFEGPAADLRIRNELYRVARESGTIVLYNRLLSVDYEYARKISQNDLKRIVRALEVFELTGKPISSLHKSLTRPSPFNMYSFFVLPKRDALYSSIDSRVDRMIQKGLVDEVRFIIDKYGEDVYPLSSIGYKEVVEYLRGNLSFDRMVSLIKRNTRNLAKRQITLFKNTVYDEIVSLDNISYQVLDSVSDIIFEKVLRLATHSGISHILSKE